MSTPEQADQPLTRKQLREIRNTAATAIVTADQLAAAEESADTAGTESVAVEPIAAVPLAAVPLARAAEPIELPPAPAPDASVDVGVAPLTRRQARQQELIRTASVPVITPDTLAAPAPSEESTSEAEDLFAPLASESASTEEAPTEEAPSEEADASFDAHHETSERPTVNPDLGSELLTGSSGPVSIPPSFDQLLARGTSATGSVATPNALILSQTPEGSMMAPVAATGEVLITGSFALPDGLGSQGHAHGTADSKETDAVLVDGELPAHSSPTPIAASAAVSTVKTADEIIRPPAPEKGGRLMLTLAITAGALALALVGLFVVAFATGVFR